jgi:hypothetical protein
MAGVEGEERKECLINALHSSLFFRNNNEWFLTGYLYGRTETHN